MKYSKLTVHTYICTYIYRFTESGLQYVLDLVLICLVWRFELSWLGLAEERGGSLDCGPSRY